jgi:carbon starvation protein CstA
MPFRNPTPAMTMADGVDYVPMPTWKNYMIQLLDIAGTGPIFGALMGAKWGPIVFLWIILGTIFGGAVHDYMAGMMSVREDGLSITSIITKHLGSWTRYLILFLVVFVMIMVSATFARSASDLLVVLTGLPLWVWMIVILGYFLLSTVLPIDKVIGRLYPVFGVLLIIMAATVIIGLFVGGYEFPGFSLENQHPTGAEFLPDMFITVACGAISGFHATQSPLVARCVERENEGFVIFYGAMVLESVIALIWAIAGLSFYGDTASLAAALGAGGASSVVHEIASTIAGPVGGIMAIIGVIICPITSGDTALRAARLMVSDDRGIDHNNKLVSIAIALVMMLFIVLLCMLDFSVLWSYFSWLNQSLATIVLWTATVFIVKVVKKKWYSLLTVIPAMFMTVTTVSYILHSTQGLSLDYNVSIIIGIAASVFAFILYLRMILRSKETE